MFIAWVVLIWKKEICGYDAKTSWTDWQHLSTPTLATMQYFRMTNSFLYCSVMIDVPKKMVSSYLHPKAPIFFCCKKKFPKKNAFCSKPKYACVEALSNISSCIRLQRRAYWTSSLTQATNLDYLPSATIAQKNIFFEHFERYICGRWICCGLVSQKVQLSAIDDESIISASVSSMKQLEVTPHVTHNSIFISQGWLLLM